jgi:hypothetical protein
MWDIKNKLIEVRKAGMVARYTYDAVRRRNNPLNFVENVQVPYKIQLAILIGFVFCISCGRSKYVEEKYETGNIKAQYHLNKLADGKTVIHGRELWLYENREKMGEVNYYYGTIVGAYITWYKNGKKELRLTLQMGVKMEVSLVGLKME